MRDLLSNQVSSALRRLSRSITVELFLNLGGLPEKTGCRRRIDSRVTPVRPRCWDCLRSFCPPSPARCSLRVQHGSTTARRCWESEAAGSLHPPPAWGKVGPCSLHRFCGRRFSSSGLDGLFGLDAYSLFGYVWLGANLLFRVVAIPLLPAGWPAHMPAARWGRP